MKRIMRFNRVGMILSMVVGMIIAACMGRGNGPEIVESDEPTAAVMQEEAQSTLSIVQDRGSDRCGWRRRVRRTNPSAARWESPSCPRRSSENLFHDMAVDVGQPLLAPAEVVGELLMVKAEKMENGGVQVVDGYGILRHLVP